MPTTNRKFSWTDDELLKDVFGFLGVLPDDLIDARGVRLQDARPICDLGFAAKVSPVQIGIRGFQIADSCFYYPQDRGIAENVRLGRDTARAISS